jgi:hypothetical protein
MLRLESELATMRKIDNKFHIEPSTGRIIKTSNGEAVPDDEPLFLLRARDWLALPLLKRYREFSVVDHCNEFQMAGIAAAIGEFERFAREHTDRMNQPGITTGL